LKDWTRNPTFFANLWLELIAIMPPSKATMTIENQIEVNLIEQLKGLKYIYRSDIVDRKTLVYISMNVTPPFQFMMAA